MARNNSRFSYDEYLRRYCPEKRKRKRLEQRHPQEPFESDYDYERRLDLAKRLEDFDRAISRTVKVKAT